MGIERLLPLACSHFGPGSAPEREVKIIVSLRPEQALCAPRLCGQKDSAHSNRRDAKDAEIGAEKALHRYCKFRSPHGSNPATLRSPSNFSRSKSLSNSDASKR